MKRIVSAILLATCILLLAGCSNIQADEPNSPVPGNVAAKAPSIVIDNQHFYAPYMPVNELPEGYEYIGVLSEDAANGTGLEGSQMYAKETDGFRDFYLYQECGTPIGKNTVDTRKRQWAYVQWAIR